MLALENDFQIRRELRGMRVSKIALVVPPRPDHP